MRPSRRILRPQGRCRGTPQRSCRISEWLSRWLSSFAYRLAGPQPIRTRSLSWWHVRRPFSAAPLQDCSTTRDPFSSELLRISCDTRAEKICCTASNALTNANSTGNVTPKNAVPSDCQHCMMSGAARRGQGHGQRVEKRLKRPADAGSKTSYSINS